MFPKAITAPLKQTLGLLFERRLCHGKTLPTWPVKGEPRKTRTQTNRNKSVNSRSALGHMLRCWIMSDDGLITATARMGYVALSRMNYRVNAEHNKNHGKDKADSLHCAETLHVA